MTFFDDESSVHDGEPVEVYEFVGSVTTFRLTSHVEDFTFMSEIYTRTTLMRDAVQLDSDPDRRVLEVTMPFDQPVIVQYALGVAPADLELTLTRVHPFTGNSRVLWRGKVTAITIQGRVAKMRVPSLLSDAIETAVPTVQYQQICNHVLYDDRCDVDPLQFRIPTTATAISSDGLEIDVQAYQTAGDFYVGGEMVRVTDGDRRLILGQETNKLTISTPFRALAVSDSIEIFAGCDHLHETCFKKFNNRDRFGGHAFVPLENIFTIYLGMKGKK